MPTDKFSSFSFLILNLNIVFIEIGSGIAEAGVGVGGEVGGLAAKQQWSQHGPVLYIIAVLARGDCAMRRSRLG